MDALWQHQVLKTNGAAFGFVAVECKVNMHCVLAAVIPAGHCLSINLCVRVCVRVLNNIQQTLGWTEARQEFRAAQIVLRGSTLWTGGQVATEASLSMA